MPPTVTALPAIMRAIAITTPGGPEVLQVTERPLPRPGPGDVLIRVAAAGVNRPDCLQRAGNYPPPPGASDLPGLEISGAVVALGEGATGIAVGDEVCALVAGGGYAEYCAAPAGTCLPCPAGVSLADAATLPETMFTVWSNVFDRGRLKAGERFLVHGGSSGIGVTAIQLAKAFGAEVFATAGSPEKLAVCRALGADHVIDYREQDFVAEVKAVAKEGVDLILDMVGGPYTPRNLKILAPEGRLVQIAFLQGARAEIDWLAVMQKRLTLTGSTLRPRPVAFKAAIAAALKENVWPLISAGTVRTVVHARFPLAEAAAAHTLMESSAHIGKILLEVG